jgi:hypothetical protein
MVKTKNLTERLPSCYLLFKEHVDNLLYEKSDEYCFTESLFDVHKICDENEQASILVINEAKLTRVERDRLDHWRTAHRTSSGERFKERCSTCEKGKRKAVYKRNPLFNGTSAISNKPY